MTKTTSIPDVHENQSHLSVDERLISESPVLTKKEVTTKIIKLTALILALAIAVGTAVVAGVLGMPLMAIATGAALLAAVVLSYLLLRRREPSKPTEELLGPQKHVPKDIAAQVQPSVPLDYQKLLRNEWTLVNTLSEINISWTLQDPNQRYYVWEHQGAPITLVATTGDIAKPRLKTSGRVMIVNAANSNMQSGGAGTNAALSAATHPTCWNNTRTSGGKINTGKGLSVGECRSAPRINRDGTNNDTNPGEAHFLAQLLGPKYEGELKAHPEKLSDVIKKAYLNCFDEALNNQATVVQVPLISSSIYSPGGKLELEPVNQTKPNSSAYKLYHIHT